MQQEKESLLKELQKLKESATSETISKFPESEINQNNSNQYTQESLNNQIESLAQPNSLGSSRNATQRWQNSSIIPQEQPIASIPSNPRHQNRDSIEIEEKTLAHIDQDKLQEKSETLKEQKQYSIQYQQKLSMVSSFIKTNVIEDIPIDILIQFCISNIVEEQATLVYFLPTYILT